MSCQPQNTKIQLLTSCLFILSTLQLQRNYNTFLAPAKKNQNVALAEGYLFPCQIRVIQVFCVLCSCDTLWTLTPLVCWSEWKFAPGSKNQPLQVFNKLQTGQVQYFHVSPFNYGLVALKKRSVLLTLALFSTVCVFWSGRMSIWAHQLSHTHRPFQSCKLRSVLEGNRVEGRTCQTVPAILCGCCLQTSKRFLCRAEMTISMPMSNCMA